MGQKRSPEIILANLAVLKVFLWLKLLSLIKHKGEHEQSQRNITANR